MDDQQAVQSKKQLPSLWTTTTSYIYIYITPTTTHVVQSQLTKISK